MVAILALVSKLVLEMGRMTGLNKSTHAWRFVRSFDEFLTGDIVKMQNSGHVRCQQKGNTKGYMTKLGLSPTN